MMTFERSDSIMIHGRKKRPGKAVFAEARWSAGLASPAFGQPVRKSIHQSLRQAKACTPTITAGRKTKV
jgi:hypothetical protein